MYPVCPSAGISDAKNYRLALLEGGRGASEVRIRLHCLACCVYVRTYMGCNSVSVDCFRESGHLLNARMCEKLTCCDSVWQQL